MAPLSTLIYFVSGFSNLKLIENISDDNLIKILNEIRNKKSGQKV